MKRNRKLKPKTKSATDGEKMPRLPDSAHFQTSPKAKRKSELKYVHDDLQAWPL